MKYSFDKRIDRTEMNSIKHSFKKEFQIKEEAIPLWVADMDFESPKEIKDAMKRCCEFGIYGYTGQKEEYYEAVISFMKRHHDWMIKKEWIRPVPTIVSALAAIIVAVTNESEAVMIQQPVYPPFEKLITINKRKLVVNELQVHNGFYTIDFEKMEQQIKKHNVKLLIFCSPHNPVGRVWTRNELETLGALCVKYDVNIVSDEIHADFVYGDRKHTVLATINDAIAKQTITCTSPGKSFNLAGLEVANVICSNEKLYTTFCKQLEKMALPDVTLIASEACKAAYLYGDEWLQQVKDYLYENIQFVTEFIEREIPSITVTKLEGTYLLWLDMRKLNRNEEELAASLANEALVWMSDGKTFGACGKGFMRMNVACPKSILEDAMHRLKDWTLKRK